MYEPVEDGTLLLIQYAICPVPAPFKYLNNSNIVFLKSKIDLFRLAWPEEPIGQLHLEWT